MKLANGKKSKLLEYLMIIVGTGLMSLAINSVFDASGMVTGGFSGAKRVKLTLGEFALAERRIFLVPSIVLIAMIISSLLG